MVTDIEILKTGMRMWKTIREIVKHDYDDPRFAPCLSISDTKKIILNRMHCRNEIKYTIEMNSCCALCALYRDARARLCGSCPLGHCAGMNTAWDRLLASWGRRDRKDKALEAIDAIIAAHKGAIRKEKQ